MVRMVFAAFERNLLVDEQQVSNPGCQGGGRIRIVLPRVLDGGLILVLGHPAFCRVPGIL